MYCALCGHFLGVLEFCGFFFFTDEGNETDTESYSYDPQPSMSGIHSYDFRHDIIWIEEKFCFLSMKFNFHLIAKEHICVQLNFACYVFRFVCKLIPPTPHPPNGRFSFVYIFQCI